MISPIPSPRIHWQFRVPNWDNPKVFKTLEVLGSPVKGFDLVVRRNYKPEDETLEETYWIGDIASDHLDSRPTPTEGDGFETQTPAINVDPVDYLEAIAKEIAAPGITYFESIDVWTTDPITQNCQWWAIEVIKELIEYEMLEASALERSSTIPIYNTKFGL